MTVSGRQHTFPKSERLTGKKNIEELFQKGSSFFLHPFLLRYTVSSDKTHRLVISVPKKKFKKAVHRNLIKRRIRESYRLNKAGLAKTEKFYNLGIIYLDSSLLSFKELESKLILLMGRFNSEIRKNEK